MPHFVTERCVDCRYTDCCTVCPVDCFYEIQNPAMLVIDPDTCIDCALCIPACPIQAIWPEDELPEAYEVWIGRNAELYVGGTNIKARKDPLPTAVELATLQDREKERGYNIREPSGAGEGAGAAEAVAVSEADVLNATASSRFKWRTIRGIATELGASHNAVRNELESLVGKGGIRKFPSRNPKGPALFGAVSKVGRGPRL